MSEYPPKGTILILKSMATEFCMSKTIAEEEEIYFNSHGNSGKVMVLDAGFYNGITKFKLLFLDNGITGWAYISTDIDWKNMVVKS